MLKLLARYAIITTLIAGIVNIHLPLSLAAGDSSTSVSDETTLASYTVGEGYDFATRVLADPWDMSEYTDINQWLNHTGTANYLLNIQVQDGIFSAYSSSGGSYFFTLFPGYDPGMNSGKIGRILPINSSLYSCFYMAMQVQNPAAAYYQFTWGDASVVPSVWGMPYGLNLTNNIWKLYRVDLKTWPYISGTKWTARSAWHNLSIVPSLTGGTPFAVDWVRLTNCTPVYVNLISLPANTYDIWLTDTDPAHSILAVQSITPQPDGSYAWDVQGIQPGAYTYAVRLSGTTTVVQQGQLTIVPTPILHFTQPSSLSGPDYATSFGNLWDMDSTDIDRVDCASWSFQDGIFKIDTLPPAFIEAACVGESAGESDPRMFMNVPGYGNPAAFRYFSFSHTIDGAWSTIEEGMIVRLFWILNYNGLPCYYVSRAISLDVGWQTYSADLYDPFNGYPEKVFPSSCPVKSWRDQAQVGPLILLDIEPNENVTDYTFHQQFDWVRLSMPDQVVRGQPFEISLLVNKPNSQIRSLTFYYTTDLTQPMQHLAQRYPVSLAPFTSYLPLLFSKNNPPAQDPTAEISFLWDTSSVSAGSYSICALANDGYSQSLYCSQTLVTVTQ